jgi:hypothetical protein
MHPRDLEAIVDRECRRLPLPRAPESLLPRVMAAVQAWTLRPWYARAWFTWPVWLQAGAIAAFVALAAAGAFVMPRAQGAVRDAVSAPAANILSSVSVPMRGVEIAASMALVLWRLVIEPLTPYVFVIVLMMGAACAVCAAAIDRLTWAQRM